MIRAAATGRIDYSKAESTCKLWLVRESLILDALEAESTTMLLAGRHLQQVTTASGPCAGQADLYNDNYKRGNEHLKAIGQLLFPYMKWDEKERYKTDLDQMRQEYTAKYGDPNAPEAKRRERQNLETLKRQALLAEQKAVMDAESAVNKKVALEQLRSKRNQYKR